MPEFDLIARIRDRIRQGIAASRDDVMLGIGDDGRRARVVHAIAVVA